MFFLSSDDSYFCYNMSDTLKVAKYYRMPEEEQREHKNPMCHTFPRIGIHVPHFKSVYIFDCIPSLL